MPMNSLPRWLISITDMPLPCQSSISAAAVRRTDSGRTAGPGLKLKMRIGSLVRPSPHVAAKRTLSRVHGRFHNPACGSRPTSRSILASAKRRRLDYAPLSNLREEMMRTEYRTAGILLAASMLAAPIALAQTSANSAQIKRGDYLVTFGGCHD